MIGTIIGYWLVFMTAMIILYAAIITALEILGGMAKLVFGGTQSGTDE